MLLWQYLCDCYDNVVMVIVAMVRYISYSNICYYSVTMIIVAMVTYALLFFFYRLHGFTTFIIQNVHIMNGNCM